MDTPFKTFTMSQPDNQVSPARNNDRRDRGELDIGAGGDGGNDALDDEVREDRLMRSWK